MASTAVFRSSSASGALALALALAVSAPATAQQMYPGQDIRVNPAAEGGQKTLLYPDREHVRVQPHLLQPGQTQRLAPIHLHMPGTPHHKMVVRHHETHRAVAAQSQEPAPGPSEAAAAPEPAPVRHRARTHVATQSRTPAPTTIPFSFGGEGPVTHTATPPATPAPPPAKQRQAQKAAPAPNPAPAQPSPEVSAAPPPGPAPAAKHPAVTLASARPLPKSLPRATDIHTGSRQAAILFQSGSTELSDDGNSKLKDLAFSLMTALGNGAEEVELVAYGGSPGDKSSSARRISLKRALAVRESLIVYGVPANRIDVRALGGADSGAPDRVDIFVKG